MTHADFLYGAWLGACGGFVMSAIVAAWLIRTSKPMVEPISEYEGERQ